MAAASGVIEAISIKPLKEVDKYGNAFRGSVKIGEDWYSYGAIKKDSINNKVGEDWHTLGKGDEVEFLFESNGDFKNIKKQSFSVTKIGTPSPPQSQGTRSVGAAGQKYSNVNPAARGQAMNLAAEVLGYKQQDFEDEVKVKAAIEWYKETVSLFEELWDKEPKSDKPVEEEEEEEI